MESSSTGPRGEPEQPSSGLRATERDPESAVADSQRANPETAQEESGLGQEERQLIAQITSRSFSGPLPPPAVLERYDEVLPGSAERILAMAENEQRHRHGYDNSLLSLFTRGQWFAFVLGLAALSAGTYLLSIGRDLGGFSALILGLAPIVAALLFRRKYPLPKLSSEEESNP